jgi:hypothetical protein
LARAFPPFNPPSRPNATAAGFLPSFGSGNCPVDWSTIHPASWFVSRERFPFELVSQTWAATRNTNRGQKISN